MTQTVQQYLDGVIAAATPSQDERSQAGSHRADIESWLQTDLDIFRMFETGSWSHGTAASPWSDIDYFASIRHERPATGEEDLATLSQSLRYRFSGESVSVDPPAVRVRFSDGVTVEIAPAHITLNDDFFIPEPDGSGWIKSSPLKHNAYVDETQTSVPRVKSFVRLLKVWKYAWNLPISSLYLEMRAAKHLRDHPPLVMVMDLAWLLQELDASALAAMNDPSRFDGRRIPAAKGIDLESMRGFVGVACKAASAAQDLYHEGEHGKAIEFLRILFEAT